MAGFDTDNIAARTTDVAASDTGNQFNPSQMLGGFANLQNSLNQNKMFQAKALAGQYLEQSVGPDGRPDLNKFGALLQSDQRTAPYAQEAWQGVAELQGKNLSNQGAQLGIAGTQTDNARKILATAGVMSKNPDPAAAALENKRNAVSQLSVGVQNNLLSPEVFNNIVNSPDFDGIIQSAALSGAGGDIARQAVAPDITGVSTGQGTQFVSKNPVTGAVANAAGPSSFIHNELTPTDLATPIDVVNPDGSKSRHILSDYLNPDLSRKPGATLPLIDAGPLTTTARTALGAAYGPQIATFEADVGAAPQTKQLIEQMRSSVGQFQTGPNSDFWKQVGQLASEYHIKGFDPNDVKTSASETFNKIVPTLLRQQASMLGMNETDTGRQIASAAIPTSGMTEAGIKKVLGILEGNVDAISAQGKVWAQQKASHGEGTYGNFRMEFPSKVPPTIFQSQYMTPQEIQEMQKDWTPAQRTQWESRKNLAKQQGWLPNAE